MQLDDLNVLAAFLAVAEERSFTRAAKRVGVLRSALSPAAQRKPVATLIANAATSVGLATQ
jgi:hypothetical protein